MRVKKMVVQGIGGLVAASGMVIPFLLFPQESPLFYSYTAGILGFFGGIWVGEINANWPTGREKE